MAIEFSPRREVLMGKLIYSAIASADGYIEDSEGSFDWAAPDEQLLRFVNDLERPIGTYLYGRRMYQTMLYWETGHLVPGQPSLAQEFASIWQSAEKIVFSTTLASVSSAKTRIERNFDRGMVRELKSATEHDMTVGGAGLAGQALMAGLVDELQLFLVPVVVGGGKPALSRGVRAELQLLETQSFAGGAVYLRYRPKSA
jgi:dihydrofolate reductase